MPLLLRVLLVIHHPWRAEAVGEHRELLRPEGLVEGHEHLAALGKRLVDALGLGVAGDVDGDREAGERRRVAGGESEPMSTWSPATRRTWMILSRSAGGHSLPPIGASP
jgi:hypothetical protein